jgi:hypothetical protein
MQVILILILSSQTLNMDSKRGKKANRAGKQGLLV